MALSESSDLDLLLNNCEVVSCKVGERLARPDEFPPWIFRIKQGQLRLLFNSNEQNGIQTISKVGPGSWIGLSNYLFGEPCEWVTASENTILEAIKAENVAELIWTDENIMNQVINLDHPQLIFTALQIWLSNLPTLPTSSDLFIRQAVSSSILIDPKHLPNKINLEDDYIIIGANHSSEYLGKQVNTIKSISTNTAFNSPPLLLAIPKILIKNSKLALDHLNDLIPESKSSNSLLISNYLSDKDNQAESPDAYLLGIRDDSNAKLHERFPERRGQGTYGSELAVFEMAAKTLNYPFRRDQLKKKIEALTQNNRTYSNLLIAKICTYMGLEARPVTIRSSDIRKVTPPLLIEENGIPVLIHAFRGKSYISGDGKSSLKERSLQELIKGQSELAFVSIKKKSNSESDRFSWNWVWGIVRKYRGSLLLVVIISLMAQLFALGVPLLLQQLIDKVLSQGNVSSLNALAALMITFALFQNILTGLRTFLFVDTTDRIDLTLGSSIIDRLLKLPLSFYEKRPVGELSQRLSEMNTIRKFLTGTAITTFLDLVFSSIYLMVMLSYSPGLTAIALSTFPFYLAITFLSAPIYRQLLRARAVAQAETQSHLIESLSGIQTIKAQHGEIRARWKWQKRYQNFVEQGYKAVILGTTTGQIGSFLNTLSSLLILWFGLKLVLNGQFTLGQLLAFRIFAGYVTAPLLRISNLWQGVQKVNLSMERLSDIVNQPTEAGEFDNDQISLPLIKGSVKIDKLDFSFESSNNLQLNNVSIEINEGEFIGVVGLSGSGKSTLMKLIARLYQPKSGKILIDDIDISKVQLSSLRSQVGLVPQDGVLFEGSIAENIALNDPSVDQADIVSAAKLALAHDFIMELPQGYATRVAEKGANFSGGQRQRLAIARMVIESPRMLILDEATSALDADTEKKVSRNLMSVMDGKTVFFVTHRMATIMKADRVIVMDKGSVIEFGNPQQLIEEDGIFAALWNQQR